MASGHNQLWRPPAANFRLWFQKKREIVFGQPQILDKTGSIIIDHLNIIWPSFNNIIFEKEDHVEFKYILKFKFEFYKLPKKDAKLKNDQNVIQMKVSYIVPGL